MGFVITDNGSRVDIDEVEGEANLLQLYEDVVCEHYTDVYRIKCIKAWGKLERSGWAILPVLHELTKSSNKKISEISSESIKKIDPGAPNISGSTTLSVNANGHPSTCSCNHCQNVITPAYTTRKGAKSGFAQLNNKVEKKFAVIDNYGQTQWKELLVSKVTVTDIPIVKGDLAEGTRVTGVCSFCGKHAVFPKNLRQANKTMVGDKTLYCNFCLRNEYYKEKISRNTLLMSFRGIIGYYYYCFHSVPKMTTIHLSDLEAYIGLHVKMGAQNPLFRYDPDSYIWFIDFSKVGSKKQQMPLNCVLETVIDILASFNLYENAKECSPATLYNKYKEAIVDFHHHRSRPDSQKILAPTLYGCGIPYENAATKTIIPVSMLRNFVPAHLIEMAGKKNRVSYCG